MILPTEKIQKVLASYGLGSRREIEKWIEAGDIHVNGKLATLGDRISEADQLKVKGKPFRRQSADSFTPQVLMYNKPEGEMCTRSDPQGRPTVFDNLPKAQGRWVMVGRLDFNTSGLLLFTNDGELANRLMHPSHEVEREYAVRVLGELTKEQIKTVTTGVMLEDGEAKFDRIQEAGGEGVNRWYHVVLTRGRNREVRRLMEFLELTVSRLIRIRYDYVLLDRNIRQGKFEHMSPEGVEALRVSVDMAPAKPEAAPEKREPRAQASKRPDRSGNPPRKPGEKKGYAKRLRAAKREQEGEVLEKRESRSAGAKQGKPRASGSSHSPRKGGDSKRHR
jgi:23S rRNA pseudouridine2605 synthase